ncbi:MAG: hypothetical protein ACR2KL_11690 [Nocardioidaceae bacterium]
MPMPAPPAGTEPQPGPRRKREIRQLVRALGEGPATHDELAQRVGAAYWDEARFDQALTWAVEHRQVRRDAEGHYTAVG